VPNFFTALIFAEMLLLGSGDPAGSPLWIERTSIIDVVGRKWLCILAANPPLSAPQKNDNLTRVLRK
jgi:hypothetical protein